MSNTRISIRPGTEAEWPLVFASWLRTFDKFGQRERAVPSGLFYKYHHAIIELILGRSRLLVATSPEDPVAVLGYLVAEPNVVHYVYTKPEFEGFGIATALLKSLGEDLNGWEFSHQTERGRDLARKWAKARYNPSRW